MAIVFPVTPPSTPGFRTSRFSLNANTNIHRSPMDRTEQAVERPGAIWQGQFTLPTMLRVQAAAWIGFLASLRGRFGTFYARDPDAATPQGTVSSAVVNGANQTGHTLNVTMTGSLLAGDFFHLTDTGRFHMVVQDQSGSGALEIEPALRESPANAEVLVWTNPRVKMRLASDLSSWDADQLSRYGLSFTAVEALI